MDWERDYFRRWVVSQVRSREGGEKKPVPDSFRVDMERVEEGPDWWVVTDEGLGSPMVVKVGMGPRRLVGEWSSVRREVGLVGFFSQADVLTRREWREATRQRTEELYAVQSTLQQLSKAVDSLARCIEDLTLRVDTISTELEVRPVVKHVTLSDLGTDRYVLKEPIHVIIEEYADETIASYPEISTYASGDTEGEAIAKLKAGILALYEDLVSSKPEELGPLPLGWLRILRRIIEKRG